MGVITPYILGKDPTASTIHKNCPIRQELHEIKQKYYLKSIKIFYKQIASLFALMYDRKPTYIEKWN